MALRVNRSCFRLMGTGWFGQFCEGYLAAVSLATYQDFTLTPTLSLEGEG